MANRVSNRVIALGIILSLGCSIIWLLIGLAPNTRFSDARHNATPAAASATPKPSKPPSQHVAFRGKLLLERSIYQRLGRESAGIYELVSGDDQPRESSFRRSDMQIATSADGRYAVIYPHHLVDKQTAKTSPLSVDTPFKDPNFLVKADFSPDGKHLAYLAYSNLDAPALFVLHLASNSLKKIRQGVCGRYIGVAGQVCTALQAPLWLDANAFLFGYYAGRLPSTIGRGSENPETRNRLTIVSSQGETIQTFEREPLVFAGDYHNKRGNIIVISTRQTLHSYGWLDVADLLKGVYNPHPLPEGTAGESVSPDGRYILWPGRPWKLFEIGTQKESSLGTSSVAPVLHRCLWYQDQTGVVCTGGDRGNPNRALVIVIPLSDATGGTVFSWDRRVEDWELLDWLP